MSTKNDKFLMVDKIDEMKPVKKHGIHVEYGARVIIYGLLIFIFLMGTFVSYFSLYLNCRDKVVSYNEESNITYNVCLDNNNIYIKEDVI